MAAKAQPTWTNRITGYRLVPPEDLLANPKNFRRHPNAQREAMRGALNALGWLAPVIQNTATGHLIDGHLRIEEAISAGVALVPVVDVDISEAEENLALATFDPLTAMAVHDREALDHLLREVDTTETALQQLCASLAAQAGLTPVDDPLSEWAGMPAFEQADEESFDAIKVHFATDTDRAAFLALMGEDPDRRKSIWYPKREYEKQSA